MNLLRYEPAIRNHTIKAKTTRKSTKLVAKSYIHGHRVVTLDQIEGLAGLFFVPDPFCVDMS